MTSNYYCRPVTKEIARDRFFINSIVFARPVPIFCAIVARSTRSRHTDRPGQEIMYLKGAPKGMLRSAWLGRFCGVKTWNSIFRRVIACTTSSACGVKVQKWSISVASCVITCFYSRDLAILSCVIAFTGTSLEEPPLNVFMLILDRESFDIMRGSGFIDKKCICVGQTPLYANHQILKLLKLKINCTIISEIKCLRTVMDDFF